MRVALVYDRLNKLGGAERVLTAFASLFPHADWYTSTHNPTKTPFTQSWRVNSSFLSRLPFLRDHHEYLPLLMPFIFESFEFSAYDLVISIGSAECKGVITKPGTTHLHYCLTPTRYLYSHHKQYLRHPLAQLAARPLRAWDQVAATRPDIMIAISTQVKNRIKQYYHRESDVIYPPVDTAKYQKMLPNPSTLKGIDLPPSYFLVVSRLVPYKKLAFLLQVFARLPSQQLVIAGIGSQARALRKAAPPNVRFLGYVPEPLLPALYRQATAYLQANEEDFGISMVEANAAGTPIIAYAKGGSADIVTPQTGILLPTHSLDLWATTIDNFRPKRFDSEACRQNASRFDLALWKQQIQERINSIV